MVWDIEKGSILELSEGKKISKAYHGYKKYKDDVIKVVYGDPPLFWPLDWPKHQKQFEKERYWVLSGFFN